MHLTLFKKYLAMPFNNKKGMEEPIEQNLGVESEEPKEYAYDDF